MKLSKSLSKITDKNMFRRHNKLYVQNIWIANRRFWNFSKNLPKITEKIVLRNQFLLSVQWIFPSSILSKTYNVKCTQKIDREQKILEIFKIVVENYRQNMFSHTILVSVQSNFSKLMISQTYIVLCTKYLDRIQKILKIFKNFALNYWKKVLRNPFLLSVQWIFPASILSQTYNVECAKNFVRE